MKHPILFAFLLSPCVAGLLQAQINAPRVGFARYSDNSVRAVFGIPSDFIVGGQVLGFADAISFSNSGGLVAKNGHVRLVGPDFSVIAEYDAGEAAPLLNMDGGLNSAIAWLPLQHALLHWNGKSFVVTGVSEGALLTRVTSVRVQGQGLAKLLVVEPGGGVSEATISLATGDLVSLDLLPAVQGFAFQQHSFVIFHDGGGLEIASRTGALRTIALPANDLVLERMSPDWLHLSSASTKQDWILHLDSSTLELSELPSAPAGQEAQQ